MIQTTSRRSIPAEPDGHGVASRLAVGDITVFDEIYRGCSGPVYRYALALCGDPNLAADALHEAFVALFERPHAFDPLRGTLGAYLAGCARHAVLARWRDPLHQATPIDSDEDDGTGSDEHAPDPLCCALRGADGAALDLALRALPWPFREAVVLVDLQERDYREAAQIAGIPINTLRTRLLRGRRRLARALGADDTGEPR